MFAILSDAASIAAGAAQHHAAFLASSVKLAVSPWVSLAYLIAGVLFILALRGLSSPSSSRAGNRYGMVAMLIAVATTLISHYEPSFACPEITPRAGTIYICDPSPGNSLKFISIGLAVAIGAMIGVTIARRIQMTAMPQLVAAFHSLVGLAAVLVAAAAMLSPDAFGIVGADGMIHGASRIEMALGSAIGAITFSGSLIAFAKLNGNMSGAPILLPARHVINGALLLAICFFTFGFWHSQSPIDFWLVTGLAFLLGFLLIIPIGGADMPVVVSMLNSYSGWAAAAMGFTLHNTAMVITGALVGSSGDDHCGVVEREAHRRRRPARVLSLIHI